MLEKSLKMFEFNLENSEPFKVFEKSLVVVENSILPLLLRFMCETSGHEFQSVSQLLSVRNWLVHFFVFLNTCCSESYDKVCI